MENSYTRHKKTKTKKKKSIENIKINNSSKSPTSVQQNKKEIELPEQSQGSFEQNQEEVSEFTSVITYSITQEIIKHFLTIIRESSNYNKIKSIIDDLTSSILNKVAPYLYSILAILVIMFFMNCFQFYYYLRSQLSSGLYTTGLMSKGISSEIM